MTKEIALVTGAASGIGAAVSRRLAEAGVGVALCDVNAQAGQALAEEIGGKFIACDVRDYDWRHGGRRCLYCHAWSSRLCAPQRRHHDCAGK